MCCNDVMSISFLSWFLLGLCKRLDILDYLSVRVERNTFSFFFLQIRFLNYNLFIISSSLFKEINDMLACYCIVFIFVWDCR